MAEKYANDALKITKESFPIGDSQYAKVGGAYCQVADVYLAAKDFSSAIENITRALEILIPLNGENSSNCMYTLYRKAAILYMAGRHEEARPIAEKSALGYAEHFGEVHPMVVEMYSLLGDCCAALGEQDGAEKAFAKALGIAEKLYAPGTDQVMDLQKKLGMLI